MHKMTTLSGGSSEGIDIIRGIQVFILHNLSWVTMETAPDREQKHILLVYTANSLVSRRLRVRAKTAPIKTTLA